jgi:hypothetical protein
LDVRRTKINKIKIEKCYTIFTGASKNRLYHLFQLADEDLEVDVETIKPIFMRS